MARAPRPGTTPTAKQNKQDQEPERKGFVVHWGDQSWTLHLADMSARDRMAVRKATGMPWATFFGEDIFDLDSLAVIVWMARRKNGENTLTLDAVFDELGNDEAFNELLESEQLRLEAIEEGGVDDDDPLPSDAA